MLFQAFIVSFNIVVYKRAHIVVLKVMKKYERKDESSVVISSKKTAHKRASKARAFILHIKTFPYLFRMHRVILSFEQKNNNKNKLIALGESSL